MGNKKTFILVLVAVFSLIVWGQTLAAAKQIVIKCGHNGNADHPYQLGMLEAKKIIDSKSGGKIQLKLFTKGQLGDERQMQEALIIGSQEMAITGLVNLYDPAFALFDFPFLYDNRAQIKKVMYSDLMAEMSAGLVKDGVRILGIMEVGFRNITAKKPINTPADLKGFKIRTPESPAQIECFKAMGAIPTPMPFGELYGALQQGVVDGQENPLVNIILGKFWEVQKYVSVTRHIYNFAYVQVSEKFWKTLSAEDQKLITDAVRQGCEWQIDYLSDKEQEQTKFLEEKGMKFIYPDRELFRKATMPAYGSQFVKKMEPKSSHILENIRAIQAGN